MADDVTKNVEAFSAEIRRGKMRSFQIGRTTLLLMREIISQTRWSNAGELLEKIREEGKKLVSHHPEETTIANVIISSEASASAALADKDAKPVERHEQHVFLRDMVEEDYKTSIPSLKASIIVYINEELLPDIDSGADLVAQQALEHIHSDEVIMTFGKSTTVLTFLKRAARKRKFQVVVAETAPSFQGHEMAKLLSDDGINTVVISDAAVFAMMARVNTVIIGTHTIMADGGLKALNGAQAICLAAKHHSVPVIVCAAMFKLSPKFPCSYDQDTFNLLDSPHDVLKFSATCGSSDAPQLWNPVFDYVPPDLITLFISNIGGNAPSYVYRLLSELYHPDDKDI
ncbi:translation initiation factor eIF2B subunit beta-like [Sycon ciliatum]|uniref:translation initiation factor eIF2B subunit beta-like n=1 Tax=Sycon ciliatum TaxID=27933 RepID=UPI0031F6F51D